MTNTDTEAFAAEMLILAEIYGETVSPARIRAYFAALDDLELPAVRDAMRHAARTSKFFPRPAELRELVEGAVDDRAVFQWAQVVAATKRRSHEMDEAAREAVSMMGGWQRVEWVSYRACTAQDEAALRKEFLQLYRVACRRAEGTRFQLGAGTDVKALPERA